MRQVIAVVILASGIGIPVVVQAAPVPLTLDFELDGTGNALLAGQMVDSEFSALGVQITADNAAAGHPNLAIIFDSGNPTGGDSDLYTPNPGTHPSNTVPYGNILILAENAVDANGDGLIDDPDDEGNQPAGYIRFSLGTTYNAADLVLIDTEEHGTIDFLLGGTQVGMAPIPTTGNGGIVAAHFSGAEFDAFQVNLGGSGGLAEVTVVPEPASLALLACGVMAMVKRRR